MITCLTCPAVRPQAPSPEAFHEELVRKVTRLHQWDVLRANKACFAFGLEPRVPFLDKQFLQVRGQCSSFGTHSGLPLAPVKAD